MNILAVDIGGTKTLLQICSIADGNWRNLHEKRIVSADFETFDAVIDMFFSDAEFDPHQIDSACVGVAGPVNIDTAKVTNLPWLIDAKRLRTRFETGAVTLINDFQAIGAGIERLLDHDVCMLQPGLKNAQGTRVVLGAGTGLGEGIIIQRDLEYSVLPSEGGHANFAPANTVQVELLRYLMEKFEHVSYERVLSGPGLENIFDFFTAESAQSLPNVFHEKSVELGKAAAITYCALHRQFTPAEQAVSLFIDIYGAQAGNLALTCMALGGVYIAGGIAPKLIDMIKQGSFIKAFRQKGKMSELMLDFPVHVITNPEVGLMGAALVASRCR